MTNFYPMILGLDKVYVDCIVEGICGWKCIEKPYKMVLLRDAITIYAENGTDTLPADTPIYTSIENGEKDIEVADACIYVDIAGGKSVILAESCGVNGTIFENGKDKREKLFVKKNGCFEEFDIKEWAYNTALTITLDEKGNYVLRWDDNIEIYSESLVKQLKKNRMIGNFYPDVLGCETVFVKIGENNYKQLEKPYKVTVTSDKITLFSKGDVNEFDRNVEMYETLEDVHAGVQMESSAISVKLVDGSEVNLSSCNDCEGDVNGIKKERLYVRNQDGSFTPLNLQEWAKDKIFTEDFEGYCWNEKIEVYSETLKKLEGMKQDMKESRDYPYILGMDRVFMKIDTNNFKELVKPHKVVLNPDNFTVYSEGGANTFEYGTNAYKSLKDAHEDSPIEIEGAGMRLVSDDWITIENTDGCSGVVSNEKTEKLYKRNQDGSFTPFNFKEWAKGKTVTVTADWRRRAIETWSEKVDIYPESLAEHFRVINVEKVDGSQYQEKGILAKLELTDKQREVVKRLNEVLREVEKNRIQLWCTPDDSYDVRAINISEVGFVYPEGSEESNMRITDLPEKWWDIKGMTEKVEEFRVDFLDNRDFVVVE